MWRILLVLPASLLLLASGVEPAKETLNPTLPYQATKSKPITYDVDFSVVVTAPYHTKKLKVWLPLPQGDAGQEVTETALTTFPVEVKPRIGMEPRFGNTFAYFEFDHPEGGQIIRHQFSVKVWELNWNIDPTRVQDVKEWPASFDAYRKPDQTVVLDDDLLKQFRRIIPEKKGAMRDLTQLLTWVQENLTYDHDNASLKASSQHALREKRGHCSDYHGLCAAFGRALGFPTRVTYGINPFPKNSPSHCKLEAFLPPYGWVSFDVSETQRLIGAIEKDKTLSAEKKAELVKTARERLARGFRDNTWFLQTRGTDYDLVPPARGRVPVVRTIYAEADNEPLAEPDPASKKHEFSWMTVHRYTPSAKVSYPFVDWKSLEEKR